ncbi:MAG TPA: efflux RND transporter periplasmic adaptor subunit [Flavisolibacter sp.]|jgi:RND family efflux transporter MFP subunit|nr:efflux RND transporter periplasmic adaptor subunit [Flavisolibacter sp.]
MKRYLIGLVLVSLVAASCGSSKKDEAGNLNDKKAELQKLKEEQAKLTEKITTIEKEVGKLDTNAVAKPKLVAVAAIDPQSFEHFIDLQGKVDATNIAYVAPPNGQGGIVKALYVTQGQSVRKGQLLARLDDVLVRQQASPLRVQLASAEDTYKRTKNLFDQGVGTYQNVLNAQTAVETLRKQIGIINQQVSQMNVTAPMSGVAETVNVRVGEMFTGVSAAGPQISVVNTGKLKITALVPENYLGRVGVGTVLEIELPGTSKKLTTKVSVAGKIIDPTSRSFMIEAPVPSDPALKPNQIAIVKIRDYSAGNAITIPLNVLQNDEQGKYVIVAAQEGTKTIARKRRVVVGELYGERLEVKSGLQAGEVIVTEGYQELYEGQSLTTDTKTTAK